VLVDLEAALLAALPRAEAVIAAVRSNPRKLWELGRAWWQGGKEWSRFLDECLAVYPGDHLPIREDVLACLKDLQRTGGKIVFLTNLPPAWVRAFLAQHGLAGEILPLEGDRQASRSHKLAAAQQWCAAHAVPAPQIRDCQGRTRESAPRQAGSEQNTVLLSGDTPPLSMGHRLRATVEALRPHQWVKNILVFIPLLVGHQWDSASRLGAAGLALVAFSATASSVYVLNDLFDLDADRRHPQKRRRPFAAGRLPVTTAPFLLAVLVTVALGACALLPGLFLGTLGLYAFCSLAYALWLKWKPMIDVVLLAGLYTLRVLAGGVVVGVTPSEWLLGFSLFMFMSLAFAKRHAELTRLKSESQWGARGYLVHDLGLIETLGAASAYLAVLVLALYIQAPGTRTLYRQPAALWLLCPLLLYWTSRLWLIARRGLLDEDPIVFAFRDRVSLGVATLCGAILAVATFW
jgi:4-hydroxybenzoate polyprenyltransferase